MTEPFSVVHLEHYNAVFIQSSARISQGKYVRAGCSGLFSEQCNSNGTRLQCRAAYHPVSTLMNINQRHILTAGQTTKCIYSRGNAIKSNLFLDWKIFPLPLSGGGKCFRGKKSKQERAACREESQACNQWPGRFSGQGDIPVFLS